MSAFIVEDKTINRIVCWLNNYSSEHPYYRRLILGAAQIDETDGDWTTKLGISMLQMNVEAVNQRYGENEQPEGYAFYWEMCSDIQALKSLQCWIYQCAEGNVPEHELYKAFRQAESRLACDIVSRLDAYDKAEWA